MTLTSSQGDESGTAPSAVPLLCLPCQAPEGESWTFLLQSERFGQEDLIRDNREKADTRDKGKDLEGTGFPNPPPSGTICLAQCHPGRVGEQDCEAAWDLRPLAALRPPGGLRSACPVRGGWLKM